MIDLSAYRTGDYDPGPLWRRVLWYGVSAIIFETRIPWPSALKAGLLRLFGAEVGPDAVIKPDVKVKFPWKLRMGRRCWIGERVWIDNVAEVALGDQVVLSQGAGVFTGNHDYTAPGFDPRPGPVTIGDGAWIAAKAIVCPGVSIGELAVLTAGSVATRSLEGGAVHSGHPATRKRAREIRDTNPD